MRLIWYESDRSFVGVRGLVADTAGVAGGEPDESRLSP
jgi:hypothetical protein